MFLTEPLDEKEIEELHTAFHILEDEVERLRAEVEGYPVLEERIYDLERELERMRAALDIKGKALRETQDAVGRLRAENAELRPRAESFDALMRANPGTLSEWPRGQR
jgi:predicted RNase H-like nuclease (RuvC/YqgF family)